MLAKLLAVFWLVVCGLEFTITDNCTYSHVTCLANMNIYNSTERKCCKSLPSPSPQGKGNTERQL